MKKYVVISVYEREIMKIGAADTLSEATEIMENDFMSIFSEHYDKEDFENGIDEGDEWELSAMEAWLNASNGNYDWSIIEVE